MLQKALRLHRDGSGVTSIEYGLIALLVVLVIVTSVTSVGVQLAPLYTAVSAAL